MNVNGVRLTCTTCQRAWSLGLHVNIYERQVMESKPCPYCGSHTLRCENVATKSRFPNRKLVLAEG